MCLSFRVGVFIKKFVSFVSMITFTVCLFVCLGFVCLCRLCYCCFAYVCFRLFMWVVFWFGNHVYECLCLLCVDSYVSRVLVVSDNVHLHFNVSDCALQMCSCVLVSMF